MEDQFDRVTGLLSYMDERTAAETLVKTGVDPESAFLLVKAGSILLEDGERAFREGQD